ncbi:MAG: iron-sulfur cluster repair di-iron protein, ric [Carnobacterium sp.]|nr:iron-sulfur cluster repair di-iron protein, ric [Carnobacterium sp.]
MINTKFNDIKAKHLKRLEQFTPIVERVHGKNHPEFFKVHALFNQLNSKLQETEGRNVDLHEEFEQLREITNQYDIPDDVCESYEAVYTMLEDLDKAYADR